MRGIDHDPLRFRAFARQCRKDAVEHAKQAPAHEEIVKRLVRAIGFGSCRPCLDNPADHQHGEPRAREEKGDSRAIWRSFSKNDSDMALDLAMSSITPNRAEAWQAEPAARQAVPPIGQIIY